jgi:CelD/BcsL family acetyltransferase involved in cellulose biosynthesis
LSGVAAGLHSGTGQKPGFRIHEGAAALSRLGAAGTRPLTPFQQAGWLAAFLGAKGRTDALRLIEFECAGGSVLLPILLSRHGLVRLADIAGGKQASFHGASISGQPVYSASELREAMRDAGRALGIDAFTITDAPVIWRGEAHPLAILPRQPNPNSGWGVTLEAKGQPPFSRLPSREDRKKQRSKANKLASLGTIAAGWITDEAARLAALDQLFAWKAERFGAVGIDNPFDDAAMRDFLRHASAGANAPVRLFGLSAGAQLVAVMVTASQGTACCGMVNAYDPAPDIARTSPGEQLLWQLLHQLCAEGFEHFDLGLGEARYKAHYCPEEIQLFDLALAVSPAGHVAARLFLAWRALKRRVKQDPRLWSLVMRYRKWKARQAAASSERPG